jgi:hypothetical protein
MIPGQPWAGEWRDRDRLLLATSGLGLVVVFGLLLWGGPEPARAVDAPAIAKLTYAGGGVLRRRTGTLAWDGVRSGTVLSSRDAVYVPPGGLATVSFESGAAFDVEEKSLILVEPPEDADGALNRVALLKGSIEGASGRGAAAIRGASGVALLEPGSEGRFQARAEQGTTWFELITGRARVNGAQVSAPAYPVRLEAPRSGQRLYFAQFPAAVALRWQVGAPAELRLQVARDPAYAEVVSEAAAVGGAQAFRAPAPGSFFWRLVDAAGKPQSESRRFLVVEDRPPSLFSPIAGEVVFAPPGTQVPFWWTEVDGVSRYRVEIATDPSFRELAFAAEADGATLWADPRLPEGVYLWRVRALDPARGESPPSAPVRFRLVAQAVPNAPELFDPTIEVEDGAAR